jgi:hypothetical protein
VISTFDGKGVKRASDTRFTTLIDLGNIDGGECKVDKAMALATECLAAELGEDFVLEASHVVPIKLRDGFIVQVTLMGREA